MGNNYYQVDYANEVTKLNAEKQGLISFLKNRIKQNEKRLKQFCYEEPGYSYCEGIDDILEEILDFINKGGKK